MKICLLSTGHSPDDDRIYFKEGRSLARRFGGVTITYPEMGKRPPKDQSVEFRSFEPAKGPLRRLGNIRRIYKLGLEIGADVYHCHEPESLMGALLIKRKTDVKVIFDSHEMFGAVVAGWFPRCFWSFVEWAYKIPERFLISRCDAAIGASWAICDYLASIVGIERTTLILNVPDPAVFGETFNREWKDMTFLCHDGHLGFNRGLKTMAEAVHLVSKKHKVVFKIIGEVFGEEQAWLDEFVEKNSLKSVIVRTGWLPYEEVGRALASCHIGLIGLQPIPNNITTSSNKVFNYMLYGIPFVGPSFRLSKVKLVNEEKCGLLADSTSPQSYAEAICNMIERRDETRRMSERALAASRARYRWEHMETKLIGLYERLLAE